MGRGDRGEHWGNGMTKTKVSLAIAMKNAITKYDKLKLIKKAKINLEKAVRRPKSNQLKSRNKRQL